MQPLRLLFETQEAARDVAFMLRCEYDGCTMITLPPVYDPIALRAALDLTGADFCFDGDYYPLMLPLLDDDRVQINKEHKAERISRKAELWCSESSS